MSSIPQGSGVQAQHGVSEFTPLSNLTLVWKELTVFTELGG